MTQSTVTHEDCMALMARYPDKYFDLAVVDPPYGIGAANMKLGVGTSAKCSKIENRVWLAKDWDASIPSKEYFESLARVSKNQVIWGGNYFTEHLPPSQYFAIWDKAEGMYGRDFAECEYAWVKLGGTRIFKKAPFQSDRIHPTQKPVALYDWIFKNYAKEGDKILDTHLGSGSSRISAWKAGLDFTACELDADYYAAQEKRFKEFTAQIRMF